MIRISTWGAAAVGVLLAGCGVPMPEEFSFVRQPRPSTVSASGVAHTQSTASSGTVAATLEGVLVCARAASGTNQCTTSGTDGSWTILYLPRYERVVLTFEKEGYARMLRTFWTA